MGTYYDLLQVAPNAPADEIKRAFRREIARYHPDKVQHLGLEFQEIAATKAAELTQAYKTLTDPARRAEYDEDLGEDRGGVQAPRQASPPPPPSTARHEPAPPRPAHEAPPPPPPPDDTRPSDLGSQFSRDRAGASTLLLKAAVMRFRNVLAGEFSAFDSVPLRGFEVVCIPKPAFWSLKLPPRILGRFVDRVDATTLAETWALASRMKKDNQRDLCVFLMGPEVAPAGELAAAITEQRRKPMPAGGALVMVATNTRTWAAHVPADAPPVVRALVKRLQSA